MDSPRPRRERYFSSDPAQRAIALALYAQVEHAPLICPHGHVDPQLFADPDYQFGSPADLLIIPDHYVFRMLYSQGIPLENLGIPTVDGAKVERDHRKIWQTFSDHFYLFRGTPTGLWLRDELSVMFGVEEKLTSESAQRIYDQIEARLREPNFRPRKLYAQFNIEVLCTTDAASNSLEYHQKIRHSGWQGRILPTFRPDSVVHLGSNWPDEIRKLEQACAMDIGSYSAFIRAIEQRRVYFKYMGATATDQSARTAYTEDLSDREADQIFQRGRRAEATENDALRFAGHMLMQMARMSIDDGLVMQFHCGSFRNHNPRIFNRFGPDKGADIPISSEFTKNLKPLLDRFGNDSRLTMILFTLDESTYGRELAPLAGHYPALRLGPPWWFFDSLQGMRRYRELTAETAGFYNTVGFNDDTRAFPSIPARHDLWRRAEADWIAGLVVSGIVDIDDATEMIQDSAYRLAKKAYRF